MTYGTAKRGLGFGACGTGSALKKKSLMDSRNESMDAGVEQKWVHSMDSAFYPRKLLQCG